MEANSAVLACVPATSVDREGRGQQTNNEKGARERGAGRVTTKHVAPPSSGRHEGKEKLQDDRNTVRAPAGCNRSLPARGRGGSLASEWPVEGRRSSPPRESDLRSSVVKAGQRRACTASG